MSFSKKEMLMFLDSFNPILEKYLIDIDLKKCSNEEFELFSELYEFENNEQLSHLQKLPTLYVGRTINSVYGVSGKQKMDSMKCFDRVRGNIINKFLNINGLELLFNEHYYDFEWDMHLEMDFEDSKYAYYRDHMEHQVRNMYMMMELLNKYGFIDNITEIFLNKSISKISDYVFRRHSEYVQKLHISNQQKNMFEKCAKLYYSQIFEQFIKSYEYINTNDASQKIKKLLSFLNSKQLSLPKNQLFNEKLTFLGAVRKKDKIECTDPEKLNLDNFIKWISSIGQDQLIDSYIRDYSIRYIIKSATIVSALFHDVSYPLCFFMNMQKRVGRYLPSMNGFIHNIGNDIDKVVSTLRNSLLFVLVSEKEIRTKLAKNQKKYDHGVFSAIALLLTFYESGTIQQLSIDKQIAIELAAIAIYNHNFSYYINDNKSKEYYRPVFSQNPISFLLKICDDMQEWDRRYFEISKVNENVFCPRCGSPIIRYKYYENDELKESLFCGCFENDTNTYTKSIFFPCRNMYTVTTCRSIDVLSSNNNLIFKLNYNLLDLLHMSQISCTYALYRSKELNKLKTLMLDQSYSFGDSLVKVNNIFLDYTMSSNPIYLKARIILDYIRLKAGFENIYNLNDIITVTKEKMMLKYYNSWFNDWHKFLDTNIYGKPLSVEDISVKSKNFFLERFTNDFIEEKDNSLYLFLYLFYKKNTNDLFLDFRKQVELSIQMYANKKTESQNIELIKNSLIGLDDLLKIEIEDYVKNNRILIFRKYIIEHTEIKSNGICINNQNLGFYFELAGFILRSLFGKLDNKDTFQNTINKEYPDPSFQIGKKHKEIVIILLEDIYSIMSNQVNIYLNKFPNTNKYFEQYTMSPKLCHAIEQYVNPCNWYVPKCYAYVEFSDSNPDFYSDLLLYEILGQKIDRLQTEESDRSEEK